jgi:hypothetical protein
MILLRSALQAALETIPVPAAIPSASGAASSAGCTKRGRAGLTSPRQSGLRWTCPVIPLLYLIDPAAPFALRFR